MHAYAGWLGAALDELGLERFKLVVHDWGAMPCIPRSAAPSASSASS